MTLRAGSSTGIVTLVASTIYISNPIPVFLHSPVTHMMTESPLQKFAPYPKGISSTTSMVPVTNTPLGKHTVHTCTQLPRSHRPGYAF